MHGDHAAHFSFPKDVWRALHDAGQITEHPVFPGKEGPGARRIEDTDDVRDVIALMRLNYDRVDEGQLTCPQETGARCVAATMRRIPPVLAAASLVLAAALGLLTSRSNSA